MDEIGRISAGVKPPRNGPEWASGFAKFFLPPTVERAAHAGAVERRGRVRAQLERAVRTMRTAERAESVDLQVRLARQAARELVDAHAATQLSCDDEPLSSLANLPGAARHTRAIASLRGQDSTAEPGKLEYDDLVRLFVWLEHRIEARSPREVWLTRCLRCGTPLLLLASAAWFAAAPRNIALGKPVSASTISGHTPAAPLAKDTLYRVVDGRQIEPSLAVHTELEPKPWVKVDLGKPHRIDHVVVYPRSDCCLGEKQLPIVLELSSDDQRFEIVSSSSTVASVDFPWRFATAGATARYVRVSTDSKEPRIIVLGEIEVYGR